MMKNLYLLFFLFYSMAVNAQLPLANPAQQQRPVKPSKKLTANKEQAINSRLVYVFYEQYQSGDWVKADSTVNTYSGNRGASSNDPMVFLFDTEWRYKTIGTPNFFNYELTEQTYTANDLLAIKIIKEWVDTVWVPTNRYAYTYDGQGRELTLTNNLWDGSAWLSSYLLENTYDANGNVIRKLEHNGSPGAIDTIALNTTTYNSANKVLNNLLENWLGGVRQNIANEIYTYDGSNHLTQYNYQYWQSGAWEDYSRKKYTYDANGDNITFLEEEWQAGVWEGIRNTIYAYDANHNMLEERIQIMSGGQWEDVAKYIWTYDANYNKTSETIYDWTAGSWVASTREQWTYDANGNLKNYLFSMWNSGAWVDSYRTTSTFNAYNQMLTYVYEQYDGSTWSYSHRDTYYYETYEDGTGIASYAPNIASNVAPNPFNNTVAINLTVTEAGNYSFEVYNLSGQRIFSEVRPLYIGEQQLLWNGQDLGGTPVVTGMYFYTVSGAGQSAKGKLVKQ
ncbi:T9SS type A sorting domain-containing protein [soil metagenome]